MGVLVSWQNLTTFNSSSTYIIDSFKVTPKTLAMEILRTRLKQIEAIGEAIVYSTRRFQRALNAKQEYHGSIAEIRKAENTNTSNLSKHLPDDLSTTSKLRQTDLSQQYYGLQGYSKDPLSLEILNPSP